MQPLKDVIKNLPKSPGVYKYYDSNNVLIYVGKAKNLKNRVQSYFSKNNHNRKTENLVNQINYLEYILVPTEIDALFLENNLIKQHQPKYNILLKDDKTYPYICILNERFPRVIITRKLDKSKGQFFGPYVSSYQLKLLIKFIQKEFKIRTCTLSLTEDKIQQNKYDVCLEYHIKNCLGPCKNLQSEESYNHSIKHIISLLKGNYTDIKREISYIMLDAARTLNFEKAEEYKLHLNNIELFNSKSLVVNPKFGNIFVISLKEIDQKVYLNYLMINNGNIIQSNNLIVANINNDTIAGIIPNIISSVINKSEITNYEIISNIESESIGITSSIPKIGDKKKLLDISIKNRDKYIQRKNTNIKIRVSPILEELKNILQLKDLPVHIECFDNSNIQGTNPVSAMVCFRNAKPSKKDYRHYKIKTVEGANDFESMYEVVTRRYKRLSLEKKPLPQLILIDGGKGQLSNAYRALKDLKLHNRIPIIGIAKRLEEIYAPGDEHPIYISKKSPALRLLMQLRDEAHRFGITFHRKLRSSNSLNSSLEEIQGIGKTTVSTLLKEYKSIKNIKSKNLQELSLLIGSKKAQIILSSIKKGDI